MDAAVEHINNTAVGGGLKDRGATVNGYVRLAGAGIGGGLIRRDNGASATAPRSHLWYLSATYPVLPQVAVDAQWARYDLKASSNDADLLVLRASYAFSKRTTVYASIAHVRNDGAAVFSASGGQAGGAPAPGTSQSGIGIGVPHTF